MTDCDAFVLRGPCPIGADAARPLSTALLQPRPRRCPERLPAPSRRGRRGRCASSPWPRPAPAATRWRAPWPSALSRRWDQPVVVDNRPGGEGIVSIETFLAAREGNHTLMFNPTGVWTALQLIHENLSFDAARDLIPLSLVVLYFIALAASPRLGAATLAEIVEDGPRPPRRPHLRLRAQRALPRLHRLPESHRARPHLRPLSQSPRRAARPRRGPRRPCLPAARAAGRAGPGREAAARRRCQRRTRTARARRADGRGSGFPGVVAVRRSLPVRAQGNARSPAGAHRNGRARDHDQCRRRAAPARHRLHPAQRLPQELAAILERERKRWTEVAQKYGAKPSP